MRPIVKYLPEYVEANYNLGISYFLSNEFNKATTIFINVNHANFDHIDSIYSRGFSYWYSEDFKQVREDIWHVMCSVSA